MLRLAFWIKINHIYVGYLGSMWEENVQTQNSATGHNRQPNASASLASMQACEQQ
jgi:hypothetical protein